MKLCEKAAYIKGLAEGLDLNTDTKEGKVLKALLDLVDDMAKTIEDHEAAIDEIDGAIDEIVDGLDELDDFADELDDDLAAVEDFLDEEFDYCEDDEYDEYCDGDCENCEDADECEDCDECDECDEDMDEDEFYEVVCPNCGETVCFDSSIDPEHLSCPACQEKFSCIIEADDKEN